MKALILAAGKGTRLSAAGLGVPKPLVKVAGTTPLQHAVRWVSGLEPEAIWINVHKHAEMVREHVGEFTNGVPIRYSYEPALLGTAGAWKQLEAEWNTTSLVIYGDNFMRFDLTALLRAHQSAGRAATVALFDPARHANTGSAGGRAVTAGERVVAFQEGGDSGLVNAGVYALEPEVAANIPAGFCDFGHGVLPQLAAQGELTAHLVEAGGYCLGVDTPERLLEARRIAPLLEVP